MSPNVTYQSFQGLVMMISLQVHHYAFILMRFVFYAISNVSANCYWPNGESSRSVYHSYWYECILIRVQVLTGMLDSLPIYIRPATLMLQRACAVHRIRPRLSSTISLEWTAAVMDCVPTRETTPYGEQPAPTQLGRARSVSSSALMGRMKPVTTCR